MSQGGCFGNGSNQTRIHPEYIYIDTNKWLLNNNRITDIQCGGEHTVFLTSNFDAFVCGNNSHKQCIKNARDDVDHISTPILMAKDIKIIAVGHYTTILLSNKGNIESYGQILKKNSNHQEYFKENNINIINVKAGASFVLCLTDKNTVYSFGTNWTGQCGYNTERDNDKMQPYNIDVDVDIIDIICGGHHSILLTKQNNIYTFGYNKYNQCSSICTARAIFVPHMSDKVNELGNDYFITKIYALYYETIYIIDYFCN